MPQPPGLELKEQKRQILDLRFFPSEVPTWAPDSYPKSLTPFYIMFWE